MARAHGRSPPRARATDPVVTPSHRLLRVTIHGHMNTRRSRRRYRLLPVQRDLISDSPLDPVPGPRSNWVAHLKDGAISGEAWPQSQASRRTGSQAARRTDRHLLGPALVLPPPPPPPPPLTLSIPPRDTLARAALSVQWAHKDMGECGAFVPHGQQTRRPTHKKVPRNPTSKRPFKAMLCCYFRTIVVLIQSLVNLVSHNRSGCPHMVGGKGRDFPSRAPLRPISSVQTSCCPSSTAGPYTHRP